MFSNSIIGLLRTLCDGDSSVNSYGGGMRRKRAKLKSKEPQVKSCQMIELSLRRKTKFFSFDLLILINNTRLCYKRIF